MQMTSGFISFIKRISSPIRSTDSVGRVAYPLERWIVTSFVFSFKALRMPSKSKEPSGSRSTWR